VACCLLEDALNKTLVNDLFLDVEQHVILNLLDASQNVHIDKFVQKVLQITLLLILLVFLVLFVEGLKIVFDSADFAQPSQELAVVHDALSPLQLLRVEHDGCAYLILAGTQTRPIAIVDALCRLVVALSCACADWGLVHR
jgi:hypothetical protein